MTEAGGKILFALLVPLMVLAADAALAATEDLGKGFLHHGVATPVSNHRGTVATVDGEGRDVVLVWLFDHRGGYALLDIDAETGKAEQIPMPFPPRGDCPYASLLSSDNKYYTHFASHFVEFDPVKQAFTFFHKTAPQMAMGMTEDDNGVIWSVTYPNSGVVSFDPKTRTFTDYGYVHKENWRQYQRHVATDDKGWLYFGIGNTASQIIAFNPRTREVKEILSEDERQRGPAYVYRDMNGRVYGLPRVGMKDAWIELYDGQARRIGKLDKRRPKPIITGSQGLFYRNFPDGKRLKVCDLVTRTLVVEDPKTGETHEVKFDYTSEGAHIMGVAAAPNGTICGGTAFPMRFFSYDPKKDEWINRAAYGQWNTVARQDDRFFVGGYGAGFLLEWDPSKPWVPTQKGNEDSNPRFLTQCTPDIYRPHVLLACPDDKTVVLAGTPGYGYTGGGLLIWDRSTGKGTLLKHTDLLERQSTLGLAWLPEGAIIGGTTVAAGTGGEVKAKQAELYILDLDTKKIIWHEALFPGAGGYTDLCTNPSGLVYGVVDRHIFFVFDPRTRKVLHQQDLEPTFGSTTSQQGPRVFVGRPDRAIFRTPIKRVPPTMTS
ncbi:MAG: hypothetical protein J7M26_02470, partial [Armatimonadetes bacterium]|nr:hypothetical protein [Armatimonadota bacterium]